jgi:hypothetical protein
MPEKLLLENIKHRFYTRGQLCSHLKVWGNFNLFFHSTIRLEEEVGKEREENVFKSTFENTRRKLISI